VPKVTPYKDNRRIAAAWIPQGGWGGLAIFRELVQQPDGTIGSGWPPEMIPASGQPLSLTPIRLSEEGLQTIGGLPRDYRLTLRIRSESAKAPYGLRLRHDGKDFAELRVDPSEREIVLGSQTLPDIDGVEKLDVIVRDQVIDVCVNDQHTIVIGTAGGLRGDQLELFREGDNVDFGLMEVRPLKNNGVVD
jgi:beta-fructofuranosidase